MQKVLILYSHNTNRFYYAVKVNNESFHHPTCDALVSPYCTYVCVSFQVRLEFTGCLGGQCGNDGADVVLSRVTIVLTIERK